MGGARLSGKQIQSFTLQELSHQKKGFSIDKTKVDFEKLIEWQMFKEISGDPYGNGSGDIKRGKTLSTIRKTTNNVISISFKRNSRIC